MVTVENALGLAPFNLNSHDDAWERVVASVKSPLEPIADPSTFIGIEVEVERVYKTAHTLKLPDGVFVWNNIEDGSLRNNGREFVSIPIKGKQIPIAVGGLFTSFKKDKKTIGYEFTDRTSVHVHVNVRDLSLDGLYNFVLLYLLVEDILYDYVGGGRKNNIFCVPIKDSNFDMELKQLFACLSTKGAFIDIHSIRSWQKYTGFNMLPMLDKGTIEFRHMVGTDDTDKLIMWINAILRLKSYASSISKDKLLHYINTLNTSSDYGAFLHELFHDENSGHIWFDYSFYPNADVAIENSIMYIKKILYSDDSINAYVKKNSKSGNLVHDLLLGEVKPEFLTPFLKNQILYPKEKDSKKKVNTNAVDYEQFIAQAHAALEARVANGRAGLGGVINNIPRGIRMPQVAIDDVRWVDDVQAQPQFLDDNLDF